MKKRKKRKSLIKFVGRKQSIYGLISTIMGGVSVVTFGIMVFLTTRSAGKTNVWIGLAGLLLLMFSLAGLLTGTKSFKQKDIFYALPIVGVTINGLMFLGMVILYFFGLSLMA